MTKKIEKLTPEQEAYLPEFREEWFKIGWSSQPANKEDAEESISGMYQCIDLPAPAFTWVESPLQAQLMLNIVDNSADLVSALEGFFIAGHPDSAFFDYMQKSGEVPKDIGEKAFAGINNGFTAESVIDSFLDALLSTDSKTFLTKFKTRVEKSLGTDVFLSIFSYLKKNCAGGLLTMMSDRVYGCDLLSIPGRLANHVQALCIANIVHSLDTMSFEYHSTLLYGQTDSYWVAFYKFCQHIGVEYDDDASHKLDLWEKFVKSSGWAYPFSDRCIVCDRPEVALRDDNNVLHGEGGTALKFRDGWEIYCSHGVKVDRWIVMEPEKITIKHIDDEDSIEVRRIMQEQMGIGKYLDQSGAHTIHMDVRDDSGFVIHSSVPDDGSEDAPPGFPRALIEDKEGRRFLCGTDTSTSRVYYMEVPNTCNTCTEAGSSLAGFDESKIIAAS